MAYNPSHRISTQTQTLISIAKITEFEPELFFPINNRNIRFNTQEEQAHENFDMSNLLGIYPDPASKEVWIVYVSANKLDAFVLETQRINKTLINKKSKY